MSTDKRLVLTAVPRGPGPALDLGGGRGELRGPLSQRGYAYVNVDLRPHGPGSVLGDAQGLPFADGVFTLAVSSDSLEHFPDPERALGEVRRVLRDDGTFVIWVPFLHPFHGDDYYRFTPLGLRMLFDRTGFEIDSFEAPLWIFSVVGQALVEVFRRARLGWLERPIERAAAWLDARVSRSHGSHMSFAAAYLVVARPSTKAGSGSGTRTTEG
jgi:SAM-dependent methyltransferase